MMHYVTTLLTVAMAASVASGLPLPVTLRQQAVAPMRTASTIAAQLSVQTPGQRSQTTKPVSFGYRPELWAGESLERLLRNLDIGSILDMGTGVEVANILALGDVGRQEMDLAVAVGDLLGVGVITPVVALALIQDGIILFGTGAGDDEAVAAAASDAFKHKVKDMWQTGDIPIRLRTLNRMISHVESRKAVPEST